MDASQEAKYPHACERMEYALESGEFMFRYLATVREYGIVFDDGTSSHFIIQFCPWCGAELPPSLRDSWGERLEALGLDAYSESMPIELATDQWWRRAGL